MVYQQHRYRYDTWGNCIEKKSGAHEARSFCWDAEHQLVSAQVTRVENGRVVVEHWGYDYDPFGRRIAKYRLPAEQTAVVAPVAGRSRAALHRAGNPAQALPDTDSKRRGIALAHHLQARHGDSATHFAWDGNRLLLERKANQQTLYLYEPESFVPLALVRSDVGVETKRPDADLSELPAELYSLKDRYPEQWAAVQQRRQKLADKLGVHEQRAVQRPTAEIFHVHTDHLGTPRELTDTDGHLVWSASYKAWGTTQCIETPPRPRWIADGNTLREIAEPQVEPVTQNLRFQGQYFDSETGLHYNRFRYYDPDVGRFVSQDPIGLAGGINNYRYAPNPILWIDPMGLCIQLLSRALQRQGFKPGDPLPQGFKEKWSEWGFDYCRS